MIDRLNTLLLVELAAVAGYQRLLQSVKKTALADSDELLRLASDHQRTVTALQLSIQARGGAPDLSAEPWVGSEAAVRSVEALGVLRSPEFVSAILEVERRSLAECAAALGSLDEEARELVALELIPRQGRHVEALSALLLGLEA